MSARYVITLPPPAAGLVLNFRANSDADAQTLAQSVSTLFNLNVRLNYTEATGYGSGTAYDDYTPNSQGSTVNSPSGVQA